MKRFFNGENPVICVSVALPDEEVMQNLFPLRCLWSHKLGHGISTWQKTLRDYFIKDGFLEAATSHVIGC